jgi:Ribbon-helix-helix protein, copG family
LFSRIGCLTFAAVASKQLKDTSITVRISQPMKDAVQRLADAEHRSLSQMVAVALQHFLEARREWPPGATRKPVRRRSTAR